jgi:hypothetical protein
MGTWGSGIFSNDTAVHWTYGLRNTDDLAYVEAALDRVLTAGDECIAEDIAQEALAAAEVVARLQGNFGEKSAHTETLDAWVAGRNIEVPLELVQKALRAIERIVTEPSELFDRWKGSDEFLASVKRLKSRISAMSEAEKKHLLETYRKLSPADRRYMQRLTIRLLTKQLTESKSPD